MRECGLKQHPTQQQRSYKMSLPMRECGLKRKFYPSINHEVLSLPMRECGLKQQTFAIKDLVFCHFSCGIVD